VLEPGVVSALESCADVSPPFESGFPGGVIGSIGSVGTTLRGTRRNLLNGNDGTPRIRAAVSAEYQWAAQVQL
jgi:hypothetical protein